MESITGSMFETLTKQNYLSFKSILSTQINLKYNSRKYILPFAGLNFIYPWSSSFKSTFRLVFGFGLTFSIHKM